MPSDHQLAVEPRAGSGKGHARKLRAAGRIPAVCYSPGSAATAIQLDPEGARPPAAQELGRHEHADRSLGRRARRQGRAREGAAARSRDGRAPARGPVRGRRRQGDRGEGAGADRRHAARRDVRRRHPRLPAARDRGAVSAARDPRGAADRSGRRSRSATRSTCATSRCPRAWSSMSDPELSVRLGRAAREGGRGCAGRGGRRGRRGGRRARARALPPPPRARRPRRSRPDLAA